ncbi:MAG: AraD1 family protein [Bryobacteraceae bacterium]
MRLVQLTHAQEGRRVAVVEEPSLRLLSCDSVYALAQRALLAGIRLTDEAARSLTSSTLAYDEVYEGRSPWKLLPPFDHPSEAARCLITGTGLTHLASAANRQAMHAAGAAPTDSMRMYQWGLEGGRPQPGEIGVAPEWFYKGLGPVLRAHGEPLTVTAFSGDGGDEGEVAGLYLIDNSGAPRRVGMAQGNEFSDHVTEKKNYLYLAPSKLRCCSLGPELVVDPDFGAVPGIVRIWRGASLVWSKEIATGDARMSHTLGNLEHHHFKFPEHRRPGDAHIHFFGADAFSFGEKIHLEAGDVMEVAFEGFGRPLKNPLAVEAGAAALVTVAPV